MTIRERPILYGDSADGGGVMRRQTRKHGLSYTPEYRALQLMRLRCIDPKGCDPAKWPEDLRVRQWPEAA